VKRADLTSVVLFALAAAAILLLPRFVSDFRAQQFAYVGIYFIALLGLNVLTGYTGLISLGHGAFMAIGGYTTAILVSDQGLKLGGHTFSADVKDVWTIPLAGLVAGIIGGWLRSVRPSFGRIPTPTVWFMNSVGLNIFIAIVGISAGPGFVNGLKTQGIGLFLWGALATTVPLILGMFIAKYLFRFHDALTLGIVSGSRTTTASLGLVCDQAKSQIPALGYTVTYAVGNTLLTIWGMVIIMLLS